MRLPPLEVIASWPAPNYVNPQTRGPALLVIELVLLPLSIVCVIARLWVRIRILHSSWWDDWVMVAAAIVSSGVTASVILATQLYGWDIHAWDLTVVQISQGRKVSLAVQNLMLWTSSLTKVSILLSYLRIAPNKSTFRRLAYIYMTIIILCIGIFQIVLYTECIPVSSYWNLLAPSRDCIGEGPPLMGQGIINAATDFMVYTLPMPTLYHLQLPLAQRVGLMVLFGVGGIVCVASIMRVFWTHRVIYETYDVTWEGWELWIWTAVEANIGIICGCIPSLRRLFTSGKPRTRSSYKLGSSRTFTYRQDSSFRDLETVDVPIKGDDPVIDSSHMPPPKTFSTVAEGSVTSPSRPISEPRSMTWFSGDGESSETSIL